MMTAKFDAFPQLRYHRRNRRLSLTPLIDCVFILLVFFMLQTNFLRPHAIEFTKSAGATGAVSNMRTIAVELHDDGTLWLDGEKTGIEALQNYTADITAPGEVRVILGVDPEVILQRAVDVMDVFNQQGIFNISMSAAQKFD